MNVVRNSTVTLRLVASSNENKGRKDVRTEMMRDLKGGRYGHHISICGRVAL